MAADQGVRPPEEPGWGYLLSHHRPERYHRTLALDHGRLHLCARCSGQAAGALIFLAVFVASPGARAALLQPAAQILVALLPAVAAWDWLTQSLGRRESSNAIRLLSGALLGFALADVAALLFTGHWTFLAGAVIVFGVYLAVLAITLRITGAWRQVIEEHFPGIVIEP